MRVKIGQRLHCKRCGYRWNARKRDVRMCPECKTPYWNVKRRFVKKKKERGDV